MQYRLVNGRMNSSNNACISCKHLVNISPVTSEFKWLDSGIFAATLPQFDNRTSLDTLAFRNGLEHRN